MPALLRLVTIALEIAVGIGAILLFLNSLRQLRESNDWEGQGKAIVKMIVGGAIAILAFDMVSFRAIAPRVLEWFLGLLEIYVDLSGF